jgi:CRP/FNR family transcriptional regulator
MGNEETKDIFSGYFPFWGSLTGEQQGLLRASVRERTYKKGTTIHNGSEDCIGLLLVKSGQIRVYTVSDEGKELTLYRLFERDMCLFSASCIFQSIQFDVTVSAELDSDVFIVPSPLYKSLMETSIAVANYTNELMASHFSEVMWLMDKVMNKKLDSRLSAFLIEESVLTGSKTINITHEQIAGHLGSIREVVTRMLNYLASEGMVSLGRGSVTLVDMKRLASLAGATMR